MLFAIAQPPLDSAKVLTSESVHFPSRGDVLVTAIAKQGGLPHLTVRSPNSAQVLRTSNICSVIEWSSPIDKSNPDRVADKVSFVVVQRNPHI